MLIDEWSYVLIHKSMYGHLGGQDFSTQVWWGQKRGARLSRGGRVLSASDFQNSNAPPAVNNDHSLLRPNFAKCATKWFRNMK